MRRNQQHNRAAEGGRIDREKRVHFCFNSQTLTGYAGDTLASALLANDIHLVARSFKYHRPRGIFSSGVEEPNALVQVGPDGAHSEPNLRATQVEVYEGLVAQSQNHKGSLNFDWLAVNDLISPLIPAGFYYKTFMWPRALWKYYEHAIRAAAGMGRAPDPDSRDPDRYDHRYQYCDVLVIGGGAAGLCAARAAAGCGARVIVADEQSELGGRLLDEPFYAEWLEEAKAALADHDDTLVLPRTTVFGAYSDNYYLMVERVGDHLALDARSTYTPRQRLWHVRARQVVLATGMIERHLVFHMNDRPGIMLASAVRSYLNRYGVMAGRKPVVLTNNNSAWRTAFDLFDRGGSVQAIVDIRSNPPRPLLEAARARDITVLAGYGVTATEGRKRIRCVRVCPLDKDGNTVNGDARTIPCDLLAISGGWNPAVQLLSQRQGVLAFEPATSSFVPADQGHKDMVFAGGCRGTLCSAAAAAEGREAGLLAAKALEFHNEKPSFALPEADDEIWKRLDLQPLWELPTVRTGHRAFVDMQNDVVSDDLRLAIREGYESVEHVKRYTTTGMGTDQGKTGNVLALGLMAQMLGKEVPQIGFTTFRPPYSPVTMGAIAGRNIEPLYAPVRKTPMHRWHQGNGAVFEDVGQWKRPLCYPQNGENMHDAVQREAISVRTAVGVLDGSTLGKIDIQGPDAAEFLNRIYTNGWKKLAIGKCRYGLMLGEDGMVMDDGVTARIDENHFHMTTTTGGAARVMAWLEEWHQTEWPSLRLHMTSVTDQWAVASVAGPRARALAHKLVDDIDVSPERLPFMSFSAGHVCGGIEARLFRISFSGEPGFEFNVPARYGLAFWEKLMAVGEEFGITPYGTEVMHLLRAEKGYIIVGQDTDGTVTPHDLNMDWIVSQKKDFIGRRSLSRADMLRADRKKLVGLESENPSFVPEEGAHIVEPGATRTPPVPVLGHVTSSYYSPVLQKSIALALIRRGLEWENEVLTVDMDGERVPVRVVNPVFFDPEGKRLHA